jgi:hypothetical protein
VENTSSPAAEDTPLPTPARALALNLDPATYGGFAEIGCGQEVARWFFSVGSAATGVAKAISAYDMAVSDALYGPTQRYVSRQRLEAMLQYELDQLIQQLGPRRGDTTTFFVFADTVATRSRGRVENGHGWMGVRFQARPRESPSEIVLHVNLLDANTQHEKEALGIVGVNLLYAAFYQRASPELLITSLMHDLSRQRHGASARSMSPRSAAISIARPERGDEMTAKRPELQGLPALRTRIPGSRSVSVLISAPESHKIARSP